MLCISVEVMLLDNDFKAGLGTFIFYRLPFLKIQFFFYLVAVGILKITKFGTVFKELFYI